MQHNDLELAGSFEGNSEEEPGLLSERFLSHVFHELRTPLTVVHSYAQIALEKLPDEPEFENLRGIMHKMVEQGDQMVEMLEELLDTVRLPLGHLNLDRATLELNQLIQEVLEQLPAAWQTQVNLVCTVAPTPIRADALRLEQALHTLIKFALDTQIARKFTPTLRLECHCDTAARKVQLTLIAPGLSLTSSEQAALFDLYRPLQASLVKAGSLDISLYLALGIIKAHEGQLTYLESLPGFQVELPLA